jgi:hypothetical protein
MRRILATVGLVALIWSCGQAGPGGSPIPDYTSQQREIWSVAPAETFAGVTIADFSHFLERLRTLRGTAETGPTGKKYIEQGMTELKGAAGFDVFDTNEWKNRGVDVSAPLGFFMLSEDNGVLVLRASDAAKATDAIAKLSQNELRCEARGKWLACGDNKGIPPLAASESASAWPQVQKQIPAADVGTEVGFYLAMDHGPVAKEVAANNSSDDFEKYFAQSKGAWVGLTMAEDQIVMRGFYANPDTTRVQKYFQAQADKSLLGVASGARGVGRVLLSPKAFWKLAQDTADSRTMDQASGAFLAATGLDLRKDFVDNMTGEMLFATFQAAPSKFAGAWLVGTVDDQRTRHIAERLDGLAAGGVMAVQAQMAQNGWKLGHSTETVGGRPAYVYTLQVPPDQAKQMGMDGMEVQLTTIPGALVIAFDRASLDKVVANASQPASAFVSQLGTPEARQAFESNAALATWGMSQDPFAAMPKAQWDAMSQTWGMIHPDAPDAIREAGALMNLIYDGTMSVEIRPDGMHCFYQLTLL